MTDSHSAPELLGEIVSWDMEAKELHLDTIRDSLKTAGLDPDMMAELTPKAAFQRACSELKEDRAIDKVETGKDQIKFQFTKKLLEEGRMDYDYECVVTLATDSGKVECHEDPALAEKAEELLCHASSHRNAQDVTRLVQNLFGKNADLFPINPKKGVAYFVPDAHREFTSKVDHFLSLVGGYLSRFPVPSGTTEGNRSVKDAVEAGLSSLVAELDAAVGAWDESTRKGTVDKCLDKYNQIAYKVDAYAGYLKASTEGLQEKIKASKIALVEKITEIKPEFAPIEAVKGGGAEQKDLIEAA